MSSHNSNDPVRRASKISQAGNESMFQALVESVTEYAICMLDLDGNVVTWNAGAERTTLYAKSEIVDRHFSIFFAPEAVESGAPQRSLDDALNRGRLETEGWRLRKDGSAFWARSSLTLLRSLSGAARGFAYVTHDLTAERASGEAQARLALNLEERVRVRTEQLEALVDELKAKNEQIESLAARVSHDLNEKEILLREVYHRVKNNLQVVQSLLKMRARTLTSNDGRDAIDTAVQRVHVMSMVHEYLYQGPDMAGLSLSAFLRDVVEGAIASYAETSSRIKLQFEVDALQVPLDFAIPLGLLANELVSNCLKHGLKKGEVGGIFVSARILAGALRFVVHDDGAGLPANFSVAGCSTMGVRLASSLTHQLGGQLEFSSSSGCRVQADLTRLWPMPQPLSADISAVPAAGPPWMLPASPSKSRVKPAAHRFNGSTPFLA